MMTRIRLATTQDAPAIAKIHVDSWRSTYKGIIPDAYLDSLSYATREELWNRAVAPGSDERVFVAEQENGQVVGFVSGGPERSGDPEFDAEIFAIYLLDSVQGHGLGRRLMHAVVEWLESLGFSSLLIWVVARNPACGFYAALGGLPVRSKSVTIGGAAVEGIGYGWSNLAALPSPIPDTSEA